MKTLAKNSIEFSPKNLKHFNLLAKASILQKTLQLPFVLFFFHDFFDPLERIKFNKFLTENNLNAVIFPSKVIKLSLKSSKYKNIKKLLNNNIVSIYKKNEEVIETKLLKQLLHHENLNLVFGIWNHKIYRNFEIQKLIENKSLNQSLILTTINQQKLKLILLLTMLQTKFN